MKIVRVIIQLLIVILILAAAGGIAGFLIKTKPVAVKKPLEQGLPAVDVIQVEKLDPQVVIKAQGEFAPPRETTLSALVAGEIIHVSDKYETGLAFKRGEMILKIDDVDYKTALASAKAADRQIDSSIKDAEVALQLEQARAAQALRDWEKLGRGKEPSDLLLRKPQIAAAEARLLSAAASKDQARANIEQAQRNLDRTVVKAPYDCQILAKNIDLGAFATVGMPLFTVFEQGSVKANVPVSVEDAGFVNIESSEISASATIGGVAKSWSGTLKRSENRIDPKTRSITMVAEFTGAEMPPVGLLADFEIRGEKIEEVYKVPRIALIGQDKVIVIDEDDKLVFRDVVVARTGDKAVYLKSGVESGDRVCVTVLSRPIAGMQVKVVNDKE